MAWEETTPESYIYISAQSSAMNCHIRKLSQSWGSKVAWSLAGGPVRFDLGCLFWIDRRSDSFLFGTCTDSLLDRCLIGGWSANGGLGMPTAIHNVYNCTELRAIPAARVESHIPSRCGHDSRILSALLAITGFRHFSMK